MPKRPSTFHAPSGQPPSESQNPRSLEHIAKAIHVLESGGVIAYPTESVYGLGCDPFNEQAVKKVLALKHRSIKKGLILVASQWQQVIDHVQPLDPTLTAQLLASWSGPITWVLPAQAHVPSWLSGTYTRTLAIRISAHPIVHTLCETYKGPIVSTSANLDGEPPACDARTVKMLFENGIDYIVPGDVGPLTRPTEIRDALTGEVLRAG